MTAPLESPRTSFLSHLLPYDASERRNGDLRTGLREYQFLTNALLAAISAFEDGELDKFDALVGENACQIRAIRTAIIASKSFVDFDSLRSRIQVIQRKIEVLLSPSQLSALMRSHISLKELVGNPEQDIPLTSEEMFLIQAYLLCDAKELKPSLLCRKEIAEPKKLKRFGDVTSGFVNELVRKLRQSMAAKSVEFVRECALLLQSKPLIRMVSEDFTIKHNSCWPCTPMFWTYQTLLLFAQRESIPLIIHVKFEAKDRDHEVVDEDYLFFKVTPEGSLYSEAIPLEADIKQAACVIQGIVCANRHELPSKAEWSTAMREHSILDVVLAGAADHRQYPDPSHDHLVEEKGDVEFERYKALARTKGFSLDNPSTFFIQHVYASTVENLYGVSVKSAVSA